MNIIILTLTILTSPYLFAKDLKKSLANINIDKPLLNEIIQISPIEKHHFNLEAPQACSPLEGKSSIKPSASKVTCQFHSPGEHEITVSVCDDEKTYCKQEYIKVQVSNKKSGVKKIANAPITATAKSQNELKKIILPGFHVVGPDKVKSLLKPEHIGIIVLASAEWCPPCNKNKEFLFPQKKFQDLAKPFLKIYVDGDSSDMTKWKDILDFKYYPSFIFFNRNMEVIDLRVSDTDTYNFSKWVTEFKTNMKDPINNVKARFSARNKKSLWQKVKDFTGNTNEKKDYKRLLAWYEHNFDYLGLYKVVKDDKANSPAREMATLENLNEKINDTTSEKLKKETQQNIDQLILSILKAEPDNYPLYGTLLLKHCNFQGKAKFSKDKCTSYINKYISYMKSELEKDKDKLTVVDITARASNLHAESLKLEKLKKTPEKLLTTLRENCFDTFELLKSHSPLKSKSRYTKARQINCLSDKSLEKSGLDILNSLIKDYPYEEAYYRKKSKILVAQNRHKVALPVINKAIQYSYGNLVYYNSMAKAKILKQIGKANEAKKMLSELISSMELKKDSKRDQILVSQLRKTLTSLDNK